MHATGGKMMQTLPIMARVNVWCPQVRAIRVVITQFSHSLMDGLGSMGRVWDSVVAERLVETIRDLGGDCIVDRPEGRDNVPVSCRLEGSGEMDRFVR